MVKIFGYDFEQIQRAQQGNSSALRGPLITKTISYKIGTRLIWKDINLRHFLDSMVLLAIEGKEYRVKFASGSIGNVLTNQVFAYEPSERIL